jgi:1-acyl-sn-glycerol-3-phosphate acyltransferase
MGQAKLLTERRFSAFFATQFFGHFNDNLFKTALMVSVAYRSARLGGLSSTAVVALCAGLFVLPFFLFSAWAGQIATKFSKTVYIRWIKAAEILIMAGAGWGLWLDSLPILLGVLFLNGCQSAFFGPAKWSIVPDLVSRRELTGGNALVETGMFAALVLGTIAGGLLAANYMQAVGALAMIVAVLGLIASFGIPHTQPADSGLRLTLNPVRPAVETYRAVKTNKSVFVSVLAIGWFWFIGGTGVTLLPSFGKQVLVADETVITLFLAIFCGGVGFGSLLCERLGGKKVEIGLVPLASIGVSVTALDIYFASHSFRGAGSELMSLPLFLEQPGSGRLIIDFLLLSVFGGIYSVPLYSVVQERSDRAILSLVIAGTNVIVGFFSVLSSVVLMMLPGLGVSIPQTFLMLAVGNALVVTCLYWAMPEFLLRSLAWFVAKIMHRTGVTGEENLPEGGAALLLANHGSLVDWLIVSNACNRQVRFVMRDALATHPVVHFLSRDAKMISIAPENETQVTSHQIAADLEAGNVVCVFAEGQPVREGENIELESGLMTTLARAAIPVVPVHIDRPVSRQLNSDTKGL